MPAFLAPLSPPLPPCKLQGLGPHPPIRSCRSGAPVVLYTTHKTPQPATISIEPIEVGDDTTYVVKVGLLTVRHVTHAVPAWTCQGVPWMRP